jgi:hypothetical protein
MLNLRFSSQWLWALLLWAEIPSISERTQRFEGNYCFSLQDIQARSQQKLSSSPSSAGFLLGILFGPKTEEVCPSETSDHLRTTDVIT